MRNSSPGSRQFPGSIGTAGNHGSTVPDPNQGTGTARPSAPVVLAKRLSSHPGAHWEARVGERQRLEVVLVVEPSSQPIAVAILSDSDLKALLTQTPPEAAACWTCSECGATNPKDRRWCLLCSAHEGGDSLMPSALVHVCNCKLLTDTLARRHRDYTLPILGKSFCAETEPLPFAHGAVPRSLFLERGQ